MASGGPGAGWVCFGLVRYVLWVAGVLASAPGHAVYFSNGFLKYWLLYVYAMFGGCLLTRDRRRKYAVAGVLAAATLALAVGLNTGLHQYGDLSVMALDVGQGESVALYTREKAVLVDCGSSNSYISAGARAADQLESIGIHRLSAVAVTHYHADHTNGLEELLARMPVERLLLPEIPAGSFAKKPYSTYLSYLPPEKTAFPLKMNVTRGAASRNC